AHGGPKPTESRGGSVVPGSGRPRPATGARSPDPATPSPGTVGERDDDRVLPPVAVPRQCSGHGRPPPPDPRRRRRGGHRRAGHGPGPASAGPPGHGAGQ